MMANLMPHSPYLVANTAAVPHNDALQAVRLQLDTSLGGAEAALAALAAAFVAAPAAQVAAVFARYDADRSAALDVCEMCACVTVRSCVRDMLFVLVYVFALCGGRSALKTRINLIRLALHTSLAGAAAICGLSGGTETPAGIPAGESSRQAV
jgi:hypothetical protein